MPIKKIPAPQRNSARQGNFLDILLENFTEEEASGLE
jgi:hypothetical protein